MTTIAFRDGVMAADTSVTGGGLVDCEVIKIAQNDKGDLAGATGDAAYNFAFLGWFVGGEKHDRPEPKDGREIESVIVRKSGKLEYFDNSGLFEATAPYVAIGSGKALALGAMAHGADAEQSVKAAMKHCVYTGGKVTTLKHGEEK